MRKRVPCFRYFHLAAFVLLTCGSALADRPHQNCGNPSVFADADVNIVVLPYVSVGSPNPVLNEVGQRFALLVKFDVFSHVLGYGSLGATQMEVPRGADVTTCIPQVVIPKLLGLAPGASVITPKGKGLIIVWGVLYEEDDDIIIQTYVRFLRQGTSETLGFRISQFEFAAQPSSQVVAFAPQSFKKSLLTQIEASYARANIVHREPRDDSAGEPLPLPKCTSCPEQLARGYEVTEQQGEWIHVTWHAPDAPTLNEGWIHASGNVGGESLQRALPEMHFIQGCVGYLMQRVSASDGKHLSTARAAQATDEFQQFFAASGTANKSTSAVALELSGIIQLLQGGEVSENLVAAQKSFDTASTLVPNDPDAATLASLAQVAVQWKTKNTVAMPGVIADKLTSATVLSRTPAPALENLRSYLQLLLSAPPSTHYEGISRDAIQARLEAVSKVRVPAQ